MEDGVPGWRGRDERTTGRSLHPNLHAASQQETKHSYQLKNSASQCGSHTTRWLGLARLSSHEQAGLCSCVSGVLLGGGGSSMGAIMGFLLKVWKSYLPP